MEEKAAIDTMMNYAERMIRGYIKLRHEQGADADITDENVRFHLKLAMLLENDTWHYEF